MEPLQLAPIIWPNGADTDAAGMGAARSCHESRLPERENRFAHDLAGFEAQLKTTRMFYTPKDAIAFVTGPELPKIMDLVRTFCFEHNLLGDNVKSKDAIGIALPGGEILGSKANVNGPSSPLPQKGKQAP